jgi:PAS domain S-box-containing protein
MAAKAANEAIWELNPDAQNVWCSDVYIKSFGHTGGDCPTESWLHQVHPEDRQRVQASFASALTGDDVGWICEYRLRRADGTWANTENRAVISRDPVGTAVRVVGAILDVTANRRAQEELNRRTNELVRSNEQLRRFAFAVSHDLQAPLRMVSEYCRQLIYTESPEDTRRHVQAIQDGVGRMRAMIQDLLEFAQVSTQPPAPEARTDSGVILQLALQHLQFRVQETGARITIDPLPVVMVNDSRLLRVFQNLIGNALKYCERTPEIRISAVLHGDMWTFSIADNGIGISAEHCERVFGAFERLHGRDRYQGTGLGLALVKRIVESYGGRIWLQSEPGAGSIFHFSLPAAQDVASARGA